MFVKPETLNLIRAMDFTMRKLKGDRPRDNSPGALLGRTMVLILKKQVTKCHLFFFINII